MSVLDNPQDYKAGSPEGSIESEEEKGEEVKKKKRKRKKKEKTVIQKLASK